ncbi:MAG: thioredoxin family protein [Calditrichaeota bacterium]|nr:thioredoxin family protein [Calditrichota bacterium]
MDVIILATHNCNHRPILERELKKLSIPYRVEYFEDNMDLVEKYQVHHSPNLIVDGKVVFQAQPGQSLPSETQLRQIFGQNR